MLSNTKPVSNVTWDSVIQYEAAQSTHEYAGAQQN